MQCIYNKDNPHDFNTLTNCVTNHEKQRANPSVEKETPVNDHTLSDRMTNRSTQTVARSRESNNFDNNLDQQETRNENTSPDTRQTLANGGNIYLVEQIKKYRHRIEKLEFLSKWLGYLNHPKTWKPEDLLPLALVQDCFQQSPVENPTQTNAVLPKSDVYRPCQLLLNKKVCWMIALMLTIVIILLAVASHTHCHLNPSFKKQNKHLFSSARNHTWEELLTYGTTVRLKIRLQAARPESLLWSMYFLAWTLRPVLEKRLHISNHLAFGVYDPLSPNNTSLIQTVTHVRCHLVMNASEHPVPLKTRIQSHERFPVPYTVTLPSYSFHC